MNRLSKPRKTTSCTHSAQLATAGNGSFHLQVCSFVFSSSLFEGIPSQDISQQSLTKLLYDYRTPIQFDTKQSRPKRTYRRAIIQPEGILRKNAGPFSHKDAFLTSPSPPPPWLSPARCMAHLAALAGSQKQSAMKDAKSSRDDATRTSRRAGDGGACTTVGRSKGRPPRQRWEPAEEGHIYIYIP